MKRPAGFSLVGIFAAPIVIAVVSLLGLMAGLLGTGLFDGVSWVALLVPLLVILWALYCRRL